MSTHDRAGEIRHASETRSGEGTPEEGMLEIQMTLRSPLRYVEGCGDNLDDFAMTLEGFLSVKALELLGVVHVERMGVRKLNSGELTQQRW